MAGNFTDNEASLGGTVSPDGTPLPGDTPLPGETVADAEVWDVDEVEGSSAATILSAASRSRVVDDVWVDEDAADAVDSVDVVETGDYGRWAKSRGWSGSLGRRRRAIVALGGVLVAVLLLAALVSALGGSGDEGRSVPRVAGSASTPATVAGSGSPGTVGGGIESDVDGVGMADGSLEAEGVTGTGTAGDPALGGTEPGPPGAVPPSPPLVVPAVPSAGDILGAISTTLAGVPPAAPTVTATRMSTCRDGVPLLSPLLGVNGVIDSCS
jgi:hypothetical protein